MVTAGLFLLWCCSLVGAHCMDPEVDAWRRPISRFRDGQIPLVGWLLFSILISTVLSHAWSTYSRKEFFNSIVCMLVTGGLVFVALTASASFVHDVAAFFVLAVGYLFFTITLYRESLEWNDPFLRSIRDERPVRLDIPEHEKNRGKLWQRLFFAHQGCVAASLLVLPFLSGGLAQKILVTHLLFLMVLSECLPVRRAPVRKRRRKRLVIPR